MNRRNLRRGAGNTFGLAIVSGFALLCVLGSMLYSMGRPSQTGAPQTAGAPASGKASIMLFSASGMRLPVEQVAAHYAKLQGGEINIQFGGSNTLLSQIEVAQTGDLFLAADSSYIEDAKRKKLVRETLPIATIQAVIVVAANNPRQIKDLDDLLRADVRTAMANPDQAAVGKVVRDALQTAGKWQPLEAAVTEQGVFQPTVAEVANSVKVGAVDAGIVWDITAAADSQLAAISTPELTKAISTVTIGVLESSKQPTTALRFARFLAAKDRGLLTFQKAGYQVVDGDPWSESPELTFFCGAVNRRAVEPLIAEFEQREGVRVNTVYNGCGILTGQMKVITDWQQGKGFPDTYMACDRYYLDVVKEQFQDDIDVSETEVVIAVLKGNPRGIKSLADLNGEGLRLAVGQPKQCTIGVLTRNILQDEGVLDDVMKNVVAETCSSALLIPMVVTGSVDAAFVYESDVLGSADKIEAIRIPLPAAKAVQPFSIARSSQHKWLSRRLFDTLARHRDQFESAGFRWRLDDAAISPKPGSP